MPRLRPAAGTRAAPIAYEGTVIVTLGGPSQAVAAFNQQTGALVWKNGTSEPAPASPIVIDVDGQRQLVVFGGDRVVGMNPANGQTLWSRPHKTEWGLNISTPLWSPADHLLFVSSAYSTGSRGLAIHQSSDPYPLTEVPTWRMRPPD